MHQVTCKCAWDGEQRVMNQRIVCSIHQQEWHLHLENEKHCTEQIHKAGGKKLYLARHQVIFKSRCLHCEYNVHSFPSRSTP